MGLVSRLLGVAWLPSGGKAVDLPATDAQVTEVGKRTCWRCEVGWHGGPHCWMCGADVRLQPTGGGL